MATLKNTNDLLAQNLSTLPDNTTQEISPQDVRDAMDNTAFSSYNKISDAPLVGLKVYSPGVVYETGQGCTFGGIVQVANKQTTPGAFNPADWDATVSALPDPKVVSVTSTSEASINVDTTDVYEITAQAEPLLFGSLSGTQIDGKGLIVRITDDGTARAITYNGANFRSALILPTQTVPGQTIYFHCVRDEGATVFDIYNVSIDPSQENPDYLNTGLSSGTLTGGTLSVGTPNTTFSISAGQGYVVDTQSTPGTPTLTKLTWTAKNNLAVTDLATQLITFVSIDDQGNVVQRGTRWTPQVYRNEIVLGVVVHVDKTIVDTVNNEHHPSANASSQVADVFQGLGFINYEGNTFTANGANLNIDKSAGVMFAHGANFANDENNPHFLDLPVLSPVTFQYRFQNGDNGATGTNIDPDIYDVGGVSTAVPTNKVTVQRIYSFTSNNVKVQPGQTVYNSIADAKGNIQIEAFTTEPSIQANGLLRGFLVVKQGATDLSNTSQAFFLEAGKFGGSQGVGGLSVSTLQDAYNNSSDPEILTNATRVAVTVRQGSGSDSDNVIEGQNGAGSTTFAVTGAGDVSGNTFDGRDVSADGSKLDGIEPLADVTDSANVDSAGATMNTDTDLTGNGYFKNDGTFASPDATKVASELAIKTYVDNVASSSKDYQGGYDANTNTPDLETGTGVLKGQQWDVTTAGQFFTEDVEAGDVVTAKVDSPTVLGDWVIGQTNLTPASIKSQYESNADTNAFTDAEKTKLTGIESGATADQSDAEIETAYNNQVSEVSQAEAEAGTSTTVRRWTALRVAQAIVAKISTALKTDVAGQIVGLTEKFIPTYGDNFLAEDDADSNNKKKVRGYAIKRMVSTERVNTVSGSSITHDVDSYDQQTWTLTGSTTINAPTGSTLADGHRAVFRLVDNGIVRTLTWNAIFVPIGVTLPTTTTANKALYIGAIYNAGSSQWDVIAVNEEA